MIKSILIVTASVKYPKKPFTVKSCLFWVPLIHLGPLRYSAIKTTFNKITLNRIWSDKALNGQKKKTPMKAALFICVNGGSHYVRYLQ